MDDGKLPNKAQLIRAGADILARVFRQVFQDKHSKVLQHLGVFCGINPEEKKKMLWFFRAIIENDPQECAKQSDRYPLEALDFVFDPSTLVLKAVPNSFPKELATRDLPLAIMVHSISSNGKKVPMEQVADELNQIITRPETILASEASKAQNAILQQLQALCQTDWIEDVGV